MRSLFGLPMDAPKRKQGLILLNTGDGKGKTTAAIGVAFRVGGLGAVLSSRRNKNQPDRERATEWQALRKENGSWQRVI